MSARGPSRALPKRPLAGMFKRECWIAQTSPLDGVVLSRRFSEVSVLWTDSKKDNARLIPSRISGSNRKASRTRLSKIGNPKSKIENVYFHQTSLRCLGGSQRN